jgi:hypothetical protein
MNFLVALPGIVLAVVAFSGPLWMRLPFITNRQISWLARSLPWLRSAGLLYLALVFGWISMRDAGVTGQSQFEWMAGGAAALVLGIIGGWSAVRTGSSTSMENWIQDEARWTLYRAVAWPLLMFLPLTVPVVWLIGVLEAWLECWLAKKTWNWKIAAPWLMRSIGSGLFFIFFHNLWLACGVYALVGIVIRFAPNLVGRLSQRFIK